MRASASRLSPLGGGVMRAQIPERLHHLGASHAMSAEPLSEWFQRVGHTPALAIPSSALWRGYIGDWEIVNDRLYLVGINACFEDGTPVRLVDWFPGFSERVFAHWFSGDLRLPQGKRLAAPQSGQNRLHERDHCLRLLRGVVIHAWTRHNGVPEAGARWAWGRAVGSAPACEAQPTPPRRRA